MSPGKAGRPSTGTPIMVRIPEDLLEIVDDAAAARGCNRAEYIRQLIRQSVISPTPNARKRGRP